MRTFQIGGKEFGLSLLAHEGKSDYLLTLFCDQTRLVSFDNLALGENYFEALRQQKNIRRVLTEIGLCLVSEPETIRDQAQYAEAEERCSAILTRSKNKE